MKLFYLFLVPWSLFSYPVDIELYLAPGYRRDSFTVQVGTDVLEEKFEKAHSATETLFLNLIWDQLRLEFKGDYAWLVEAEGSVTSSIGGLGASFDANNFYGYEADLSTELGYDISVYRWRRFLLELTPLFGFGYRHIATRVKGVLNDSLDSQTGYSSFATYQETKLNHADLWGPFLEGRISFFLEKVFDFSLFYQYHFVFYRHVLEPELDSFLIPGALTWNNQTSHIVVKNNHARGQLGGFDLRFMTYSGTLFGLQGYGTKIYTNDARAEVNTNTWTLPTGATSETEGGTSADFNWTIYSILLYVGYRF